MWRTPRIRACKCSSNVATRRCSIGAKLTRNTARRWTPSRRHSSDSALGPLVLRRPHAAFDPGGADLIVTVGGDGTLLAASHSVVDVPILGVNSAPDHSIGFFCAAKRANIEEMLAAALDKRLKKVRLNRMRVAVNGRIRSRGVLNDVLLCHRSPAATSRYIIEHQGRQEEQRSSGMWVGPAAGSTAAQKSAGGRVLPLGSKKLQLVVREPYVPRGQTYKLMRILISPGEDLIVRSKMNDALMFVDGPYKKIAVALGDTVTFSNSDQPLTVLGLSRRART